MNKINPMQFLSVVLITVLLAETVESEKKMPHIENNQFNTITITSNVVGVSGTTATTVTLPYLGN